MKPRHCDRLFNEKSGFWAGLRDEATAIMEQKLADLDKPDPPLRFRRRAAAFAARPTLSQQIDAMCRDAGRETYAKDIEDFQHGGFNANAKALLVVAACRPLRIYKQIYKLTR